MELIDSFEVARPIDETWALLTDVRRVAQCFPGAQLQGVDGTGFWGVVKVRVGRIETQFTGAAEVLEANAVDHKLVVRGHGLDADDGDAEALLTAKLEPISDTITRVNVDTHLTLSGRIAQMGKGVLPDVSATLMSQFESNMAALIEDRSQRLADLPEAEAIDLLDAARTPVLKRIAGLVLVMLLIRWLLRRRRG